MAETTSEPEAPILAGVDQITVIDGDTPQVFYIARNILKSKVPEFLATLNPTKSDETLVTKTSNVAIQTFHLFVRWFTAKLCDSDPLLFALGIFDWSTLLQIYQLYAFCCKNNLITLRTQMFVSLVTYITEHASTICLEAKPRFIFAEHDAKSVAVLTNCVCECFTSNSSLYRSFLTAFCCSEDMSLSTRDRLLRYPKSFLADVMLHKADLERITSGRKRKKSI
ncbi:hypothetical protein HBH56_056270 [Parastagonospora nodorum]|uniref:Uncharacterized protein n=1 Tax=Phaeosphaeria nodorum (strain SN15 / ATCC MYA-4574 / FGSC 10173) TaxID=321614 RepID=A0A7U2FBZ4_PHANO|nr:hypothetical protein HBH56_056270 [Parastagonospora nodorum]QRD02461.1 hypothetical protein JI435_440880 [Parastagonospora nodorum SN15]KAH3935820.1 hypothetical protein HBH54_042080 [Parastagonospora nodorum]KAH3988995.1 hypothetical protein HBH52_030680 [Parastagonospora nodorum]KAH4067062.1 hypothetical protein HBH50_135000 [Parastagonospora nodorum]